MQTILRILHTYSIPFLFFFLFMNLITFALFRADKKKAEKKAFRIPESNLLGFSALFGALGGLLGMIIFHHKTRKPKFYILVPLFAVVHLIIIFFILTYK